MISMCASLLMDVVILVINMKYVLIVSVHQMVSNTSDLVRQERSYVHPVDQTPLLPSDINKYATLMDLE